MAHQVLLYQALVSLSSEALGRRHATVGATPFDLGVGGGERYRPPLEIAEASEDEAYECRIHGEVGDQIGNCVCPGQQTRARFWRSSASLPPTLKTGRPFPLNRRHQMDSSNSNMTIRWSRGARWWPRAAAGGRPSGCGSPT